MTAQTMAHAAGAGCPPWCVSDHAGDRGVLVYRGRPVNVDTPSGWPVQVVPVLEVLAEGAPEWASARGPMAAVFGRGVTAYLFLEGCGAEAFASIAEQCGNDALAVAVRDTLAAARGETAVTS
ncbi:hypothetical protein [Actinomadura macrotermitis]|uniref:Uncharacterized protein n=1 Tax=Actinomadura macrotermitis TaxID=2585200 RepID=A0A7K0BSH0_9ACTN|nr:hypothetical protein [Actinomadura macrotermitis]MQY04148.1 hypothetical protein [Actinomadura macrotermitis]